MTLGAAADHDAAPEVFRITFVCTGNICRSAQGEQLLRARIPAELRQVVQIDSAGTGALVGRAMPPEAAELSRRFGGDPDAHAGKALTSDIVRESDLVLAMAAEHRKSVVTMLPRASRNTFMLTEFAALLDDLSRNLPDPVLDEAGPQHPLATRLRALVRMTAGRRGFLPDESTPVDVVDPYRRDQAVYEESAAQVVAGIDRMIETLLRIARQVG